MKRLNVLALALAYDSGIVPGWKKDDQGNLVLKDGNPVNILPNGQEQVVGLDAISRLNSEAKEHRTAKEAAEAKLKMFEGLDPELARKAIDTVGKLDAKKLIDAGEVDKVRKEISDQYLAQIAEKESLAAQLQGQLHDMKIGKVFESSKFLNENLAVPKDFVEAAYRSNFKIEDGKIVPYGKDGNKIYSKTRIGEVADAEEALQILIESHPSKDAILKADVGSGSGNKGGGGQQGGSNIIKRSEFDKLEPMKQAEFGMKAAKGEVKIVD